MIGLQKQGKTLFYRDFLHHLAHSRDAFDIAPGIRGMVMFVFTLPSYPYVFKLIKDRIDKDGIDHATVRRKYQMMKLHDRVGRMADTWEYSQRSEEHTSQLRTLMRTSYDTLCLKKKKT